MIGVLMVSSLLNIAYLVPVFARGFFPLGQSSSQSTKAGIKEAPLLCVAPPVLTAIGCIVLFFYAGDVADFLQPIVGLAVSEGSNG